MTEDTHITLKDLFDHQQKGFSDLRNLLAEHDRRTVVLAYRTDKLEQEIPPLKASVDELQGYRKHYARVAGYVATIATLLVTGIGFIVQNVESIRSLMR